MFLSAFGVPGQYTIFANVDLYTIYPMLVLHGIQIVDFMLRRKLIKMYYPAQFRVQRLHAVG